MRLEDIEKIFIDKLLNVTGTDLSCRSGNLRAEYEEQEC